MQPTNPRTRTRAARTSSRGTTGIPGVFGAIDWGAPGVPRTVDDLPRDLAETIRGHVRTIQDDRFIQDASAPSNGPYAQFDTMSWLMLNTDRYTVSSRFASSQPRASVTMDMIYGLEHVPPWDATQHPADEVIIIVSCIGERRMRTSDARAIAILALDACLARMLTDARGRTSQADQRVRSEAGRLLKELSRDNVEVRLHIQQFSDDPGLTIASVRHHLVTRARLLLDHARAAIAHVDAVRTKQASLRPPATSAPTGSGHAAGRQLPKLPHGIDDIREGLRQSRRALQEQLRTMNQHGGKTASARGGRRGATRVRQEGR